jgi:hypothetical protein
VAPLNRAQLLPAFACWSWGLSSLLFLQFLALMGFQTNRSRFVAPLRSSMAWGVQPRADLANGECWISFPKRQYLE